MLFFVLLQVIKKKKKTSFKMCFEAWSGVLINFPLLVNNWSLSHVDNPYSVLFIRQCFNVKTTIKHNN